MSDNFIVTAEPIDDDVMIPLPEEFGICEGQVFEIVKRPTGVVVLTLVHSDDGN
jgi:hypothetical protein